MVNLKLLSTSALALAISGCASSQASTVAGSGNHNPITQSQVEGAQRAWCDALVSIASTGQAGGDAKALASRILSSAYGYDDGPVLFKPTLTHGAQTFRMDKRGALAYFVGGDASYPDDDGFALKGWTSCRPEIKGWVHDGDMAIAMGNVHIENKQGQKVMVDKTFGYKRDPAGNLKIVLHHSSLPYSPK